MNSAQAVLSAVMVVFLSQLKSIFARSSSPLASSSGSGRRCVDVLAPVSAGTDPRRGADEQSRHVRGASRRDSVRAAHAYDCEIAGRELASGTRRRPVRSRSDPERSRSQGCSAGLILRGPSSSCPGGRCGVPSAVKPQPLPNDAKASGAVEPTNEQNGKRSIRPCERGESRTLGMSNDWGTGGEKFDGPISMLSRQALSTISRP